MPLILGTAGHIDHGKTALVRALTGIDTDRLPEEKQRGMTIDIGFAALKLDGFDLGIVDVPGHEKFIRNMVAGAAGSDLAMLVVAADDSVMPQTREHLEILQLLNVRHGAIVITKCDLVAEDFLDLVDAEVCELVAGTFLEDAPLVHTSATTGAGIDRLRTVLKELCARVEAHDPGGMFRMAVDRSFAIQGQGTVVTGSVTCGTLRVGDQVQWLPKDEPLRVRSLESHDEQVDRVERGQRAAVGLHGVHHRQIVRGDELATPGLLQPSHVLTVHLRAAAASPWPIRHRGTLRIHLGTAERAARLSLLSANQLRPAEAGTAQLHLEEPVVACYGQPFVARSLSPAVTLGGGHVLEPVARPITRRRKLEIDRVAGLLSASATERAALVILGYGLRAWTDLELCRDAGLEPKAVPQLLDNLETDAAIRRFDAGPNRVLRVHRKAWDDLEARLTRTLEHFHRDNPVRAAINRPVLAEQLHLAGHEALFGQLVQTMHSAGRLTVSQNSVALADIAPKLSRKQQALYDAVIAAYVTAGFQPPTPADLARRHGAGEAPLRLIVDLAVSLGQLKHLGGAVYLHADWERKLRDQIVDELRRSEGLTISRIRQILGTSRKFAVPICEYLDRAGITRRRGDLRVLHDGVDSGTITPGKHADRP